MKQRVYAVIGTGAIGGFYGGMLAKADNDVRFLLRSDYEFVSNNGLKVDSIFGNFHINKVNAYRRTNEIGTVDVVLVCLKTTQNHLLKILLPPLLHPKTVVVLIQNGIGVEADVARDFPDLAIAGGLGFICSNKLGPGHIAHLDFGRLTIGGYQHIDVELLSSICLDFDVAGVPCDVAPDLMLARWRKLVWNLPFNGMTVILNTTTDKLIHSSATQPVIYQLMSDVVKGANHCGVALTEEFALKMIEMTKTMTPYSPSMKIDYDMKRELEVEYIYSRPIELAREAGYEMVSARMVESQLLFIEEQRRLEANENPVQA